MQKESNNSITEKSIAAAIEIVDLVNIERKNNGEEPINQGYRPEEGGPNPLFGWDIWVIDALGSYFYQSTGKTQTVMGVIPETIKAGNSLNKAADTLDATPGIDLKDAINANNALIVIESDENKIKLKQ